MSKTKCKINSDGSVCLEDILNSFNSSIREEHAWALCYQCAKFFNDTRKSQTRPHCFLVTEVSHVYLKTDGLIHEKTVTDIGNDRKQGSEKETVAGLGIVIYSALDQNSEHGEERIISNDLEQLINDMITDEESSSTGLHHETDDEGIERDAEEACASSILASFTGVIQRCEAHLGNLTKVQAETHYKAVVRALVAEALELATFLEKVAQGSINLPSNSSKQSELDQLNFSDWAKFWVQVMGELRMGVKLKKVHYSKAPIEYELTPYEILMKDIRSCRYSLRKIMLNGEVPSKITKDAHEIILEFIKSRPPLKKASDRKLPPQIRKFTPREQLMNSIRLGRKLRPTPRPRCAFPVTEPKPIETKETNQDQEQQQQSNRRLIKVDFSQLEEDYDYDDEDDSPDSSIEPGLWSTELLNQSCDNSTLDVLDLATQSIPRLKIRRHTLEVFDANVPYCHSVPHSRPASRQSYNSSETELEPEMARAIHDELMNVGSNWQETMSLEDRLSLTLSEIVHIRSVLTKAELEALPVEASVRHDVEARKVCFLCLKTRFGIFGPWGQRCTICKRTVCSKCCCKMNIPMEHFSSVPVVLLSPSIMSMPEDESFHRNLVSKLTKTNELVDSSQSDQMEIEPKLRTRARNIGRAARVVDRFKANNQMIVCHDCKMMVLQIIKSARANRTAIRNKTLQSLTLNLSPVF